MTPLRWSLVLLCAAALYVVWPLWPPLLLAAWTASLTRPLLARFERGLKGRRRAAAMLSLLLFMVLAVPIVLMALGIVSGAQELLALVRQSPSAGSALRTLSSTPSTSASAFPSTLPEVLALAQRSGTQGFDMLTNLAGAAATAAVGLFIYFAGAYTLLVDSPTAWAWVVAHAPMPPKHLERFAAAFQETGRGLLVGVGLTSAAQGVAATIIYLSLGVPRAWVLGPITGLASIVPFVGTAVVWVPIAVGLFLTAHPVKGAILIVLGIGVIGVIDNLLRPVFARFGALQLPIFVLFVSVFGGLAAFGTWGALAGPLIVRLTLEALAIARDEPAAPNDLPKRKAAD